MGLFNPLRVNNNFCSGTIAFRRFSDYTRGISNFEDLDLLPFTVVGGHEILLGIGRISRIKEHFNGLLKAIRDKNSAVYSQAVETRDLKKYEDVI